MQHGGGSQEICDCCGLQFGYQDACGGREDSREGFHIGWRVRWIWEGHPWHGHGGPPAGWSPPQQLKAIGWPPAT